MTESPRIAVLGAGNMGGALIAGMLRSGFAKPEQLTATVRSPEKAAALSDSYGIRALAGRNLDAVESADMVITAVKPHLMGGLLEEIRWGLREGRILVSVAAAFPIALIEQHIGRPFPVFRAMPNTPVVVGEGATAIAGNSHARQEHWALVEPVFRSVGAVCYLDEDQFHAVTALSGAGPAYIYMVIEAMTAAGLKVGLSRDVAARLSEQTVLGAAKLVRDSGTHPAILRDRVVTPGGVTIAGLHELERHALRSMFMTAVEAATAHSRNLSGRLNDLARTSE